MKKNTPLTLHEYSALEDKFAEAISFLHLVRESIEPDGKLPTPGTPFDREWLGQDARYGLVFTLDRVSNTLTAFRDA
ncbi:MAG: hypothetical protein WC256_10275 [Desulfurivibrionaceae bacterium]|jgi:hypothetical protein